MSVTPLTGGAKKDRDYFTYGVVFCQATWRCINLTFVLMRKAVPPLMGAFYAETILLIPRC